MNITLKKIKFMINLRSANNSINQGIMTKKTYKIKEKTKLSSSEIIKINVNKYSMKNYK